jgi:hypothetical protein
MKLLGDILNYFMDDQQRKIEVLQQTLIEFENLVNPQTLTNKQGPIDQEDSLERTTKDQDVMEFILVVRETITNIF